MEVAILAGGKGLRLAEETRFRPKALVEIGGIPILCHLIDLFGLQGYREFSVALGHRGDQIRSYFKAPPSDDLGAPLTCGSGWQVRLIDTGQETATGGRIKRLFPLLEKQPFFLANVDGLFDLDLRALEQFHRSHGKLATVVAVHPPPRFGCLHLEEDRVVEFSEKLVSDSAWINGGVWVLEPGVQEYIEDDSTEWERGPLENLARDGQLMAFQHTGYWQCMDTIHEKEQLEELWQTRRAPWNPLQRLQGTDR